MDAAVATEADEPPISDDDMASPWSSPWSSPLSSLPSSPTPTPPRSLSPVPPSATNAPTHIPTTSQAVLTNSAAEEISKASFRKKKRSHKSRTKRRQAEAHEMGYAPHRESVKRALHKHVTPSNPVKTNLSIKKTDMASTGYVGVRDLMSKKDYTLEDLVGRHSKFGFRLVEWDGVTPTPILDQLARVVALLAGRPSHNSWDTVNDKVTQAIEQARTECDFPKKARKHRRGNFPAMSVGISYGGGQTKPGNLCHNDANAAILSKLISNDSVQTVAGFASSKLHSSITLTIPIKYQRGAFATWMPKLHGYYVDHLDALLQHGCKRQRNFHNSVWSSTAVNFGPRTCCKQHKDFNNLPFGICSIFAAGQYNSKEGGHLVLWEARLVIVFPPGSTILIPSAILTHSNVLVPKGSTHYSVTQYTAGGLFRWVDHGFQSEKSYWESLTDEGCAEETLWMEGRAAMGMGLFTTKEELVA